MSGCILNIVLDPLFILHSLNMNAAGAGLAAMRQQHNYSILCCLMFKGPLLASNHQTYAGI